MSDEPEDLIRECEAELEQKPELMSSLRSFVEYSVGYSQVANEFKYHLFLEFPSIYEFMRKDNKAKVIAWIEFLLPNDHPDYHRDRQILMREYKSIPIADLPDDLKDEIKEARDTANVRIPIICNCFNMIQTLYGHDEIQKYKEFEAKQKSKEVFFIF